MDDVIIERQFSGENEQSRNILFVIAKRTYVIYPGGCAPADDPLPIRLEPSYEDGDDNTLLADVDCWPNKPSTDVVVVGHAYNHPETPVFDAAISVGSFQKQIIACGERRATLTATGHVCFSEPVSVDRVPLSYRSAYGGRDIVTEQKIGDPYLETLHAYMPPGEIDLEMVKASAGLYVYPRNASGKGYVLSDDRDAIEAAELPMLEHPNDLLTPSRLVSPTPLAWPEQPIPASLSWMDYGAFPRIAWMGAPPECDLPKDVTRLPEVRFGYAEPEVFKERPRDKINDIRMTNGASLGLRLPHLRGNETIVLQNLSENHHQLKFSLPNEVPQIWVDGRKGSLKKTEARLHSVIIEPDAFRLSLVWYGAALSLRPYFDEELEKMPFRVKW